MPVTVGALQRLAPFVLAIHGQHEQRGLTDPATHIALVDAAGGLGGEREGVAAAYALWQGAREELDSQRRALANRRDRLDVIAFQAREIEEARPESGEEEALREERAFLRHAERIGELVEGALASLSGEGGAVALARAARAVRELHALGIGVGDVAADLEQARVLVEEAERAVGELSDRVRPDPARLEHVENRLALLERLALKYGGSVGGGPRPPGHGFKPSRGSWKASRTTSCASRRSRSVLLPGISSWRKLLSGRRAAAAERFSGKVIEVLKGLGIPRARLKLALGPRISASGALEVDGVRVEPAADGIDAGEFELSTNPGEAVRSMARIASGGELSRIHLAMRTVLRDSLPRRGVLTLLFDEVDAGIGGTVADELGVLLAALGRRDQVMVVTHLPQVAGKASAHLVVRKETSRGRTVTHVEPVAGDARVEELVRMLGGGEPTAAARQHARELLKTS